MATLGFTGLAGAVLAGITSHMFYFRRGEHHMYGVLYVQLFVGFSAAATAILATNNNQTLSDAAVTVIRFATSWLIGVFSSLLLYRIFLHPLRHFPGPWQARVSALWLVSQLPKHDAYLFIRELHRRYGKYVRVGPNNLSIADAAFVGPAFAAESRVVKNEWYDVARPHDSMHTERDRAAHDRRRRFWAPAFSDRAMREYESIVREFNRKMMLQIGERQGTPMNMSKWFHLYSFDIVGHLAFGKDYGTMDSGIQHEAITLIAKGMATGARKPPIWVMRILLAIPGLAADFHRLLAWCVTELRLRVQDETKISASRKDITGWLLKVYDNSATAWQDPWLQGDTRLIIVAGSDTVASTLTSLFYHLAQDPALVARLRAELRPLVRDREDWGGRELARAAPLLNGAINEALRLYPPVPSGLGRKTPPEGLRVGDVWIPGGVSFEMPQYTIGRDPAHYTSPDDFAPERWNEKPEMIKHADAFSPFSTGPYGCIGKNLALMELRTLTTQIVLHYDVAFAPGEDGTRFRTEAEDRFTLNPGALDLAFTPATS